MCIYAGDGGQLVCIRSSCTEVIESCVLFVSCSEGKVQQVVKTTEVMRKMRRLKSLTGMDMMMMAAGRRRKRGVKMRCTDSLLAPLESKAKVHCAMFFSQFTGREDTIKAACGCVGQGRQLQLESTREGEGVLGIK